MKQAQKPAATAVMQKPSIAPKAAEPTKNAVPPTSAKVEIPQDKQIAGTEKKEQPKIENVLSDIQSRYELAQRLDKLQDTKRQLDGFRVGSEGMREQLRLSDNNGNDFQTYNSELVKEVVATAKAFVDRKIEETITALCV